MSNQEIDRLTKMLRDLEIKQNNPTSDIAKAKREIQELVKLQPERREEVVRGSGLYYGNTVTILNPSPEQTNKREVSGYIRDGLVIVQQKESNPIKRLPKNLDKQV